MKLALLVAVDLAVLVTENLDLLCASKKLWILLHWEYTWSSGSGFAGRKLVAVYMALLVADNLDLI